ncbi:MAG: DNA mismatch repair protein MutS [Anaerolineae bacterium]
MPKQTPMLRQYREIKARHADALVLYRFGDFYELFEDDAKLVSRELGLTLTTRRFAKDLRLPMCGIPHRRLNAYVARLIRQGHKVAIAEQLEDARKTSRIVKRDVVRVITPGTIVEDALLREREASLLVTVVEGDAHRKDREGYGLALVDLSTGAFAATQISGRDAEETFWQELDRLRPSEVVLPAALAEEPTFTSRLGDVGPARVSPLDDAAFSVDAARQRLEAHLRVASLEGFGCDSMPLAISAAGGALHYLQENQISNLAHIVRLVTYDLTGYVGLDTVTRANLEILRTLRDGRRQGSLYEALDRTQTAMGSRLLRRWLVQPLTDLDAIQARQAAIQTFVDGTLLRTDLRAALDGLYDVERLVGRVGFGSASARDLVALREALERVPRVRERLRTIDAARLCALDQELSAPAIAETASLIAEAITDEPPVLLREGGLIRAGYDAELDSLCKAANAGRDWLTEYEVQERARTGIKNLRVRYNQVFGFFIEVTKSNLDRVPETYERRATVRHAERFVTPELKRREAEIVTAEEQIKDLEYELFTQIRERIAASSGVLTRAASALAELDTLAALAEVAATEAYVRPELDERTTITILGGRHPVVERYLPDGERFVPNDAQFADDERLIILTGPNMSGKSVYIRQVALIVLLAQIGSFVPAEMARIGLVDRIFVRAGATDDITQGRSTFLVEMSETGYILHHATERSLVVLDEVGRGTSTYDGMSIAWAVAEELHDRVRSRTLFATHFHELTHLADHLAAAHNYTLAVTERGQQVIFLRQLLPGRADKSYGIQVARLAGISENVIARAQQILATLEDQEGAALQPASPAETSPPFTQSGAPVEQQEGTNRAAVDEIVAQIRGLDIANMTPVQALVALNGLQAMLLGRNNGSEPGYREQRQTWTAT